MFTAFLLSFAYFTRFFHIAGWLAAVCLRGKILHFNVFHALILVWNENLLYYIANDYNIN
jgi:hypothetical protein